MNAKTNLTFGIKNLYLNKKAIGHYNFLDLKF